MADREMIRIASDHLSVAINPFGAELTHITDADGRELMTDADPAFWPRHAPILFPVIGVVNQGVIRVDGTEYPMTKHGFARDLMFETARHDRDHAVLQLAASNATREMYPFDFVLDIGFRIEGFRLTLEARIANKHDTPMPAQFGFHPALAWPLPFGEPRDAHRIIFQTGEPARLKEINPDGLIAQATRPSPLDGRELLLRDALFDNDALVWDPVESNRVTYGAAQGPVLDVDFPDTPRLGIWTKPGAHFVCIEPWHGIADPEGFTGELKDKPGVFIIAPGGEKRMSMSITLVP